MVMKSENSTELITWFTSCESINHTALKQYQPSIQKGLIYCNIDFWNLVNQPKVPVNALPLIYNSTIKFQTTTVHFQDRQTQGVYCTCKLCPPRKGGFPTWGYWRERFPLIRKNSVAYSMKRLGWPLIQPSLSYLNYLIYPIVKKLLQHHCNAWIRNCYLITNRDDFLNTMSMECKASACMPLTAC